MGGYNPAPTYKGLATYYNKKLDELKVYEASTKKAIVYVQSFSSKWSGNPNMSLELLIWLSVNYKEYMEQAI